MIDLFKIDKSMFLFLIKGENFMSHSFLSTRKPLGDYCPLDGAKMTLVKREDHASYTGGYYLYFLKCPKKHKWLMIITQYDECPPTLISAWKTEFDE